jgi:hypothetical protein
MMEAQPFADLSPDLAAAFWQLVEGKADPDACWEWLGPVQSRQAHAVFRLPTRTLSAHRVAFRLSGGKVSPGQVVVRACRNQLCCNPGHLKPMTKAEHRRFQVLVDRSGPTQVGGIGCAAEPA